MRTVLEASPHPHPYRRIRRERGGFVLALREWRFGFEVAGAQVTITDVRSGYRPRELEEHPPHAAFAAERFEPVDV